MTPAQGKVAASSKDNPGGIATTPSSSSATYSASMPSSGTPSGAGYCLRSRTIGPDLEESARDAIAGFETSDAGANGNDLASAIGQGHGIAIHRE